MQFGRIERAFAGKISHPRFRRLLKTAYILANAVIFSSTTKRTVLHADAEIEDVFPSLNCQNSVGYYDINPINEIGLRFTHAYERFIAKESRLYVQSAQGDFVDEIDLSCASYQQGGRAFWWSGDQIILNQIRQGRVTTILYNLAAQREDPVDASGVGAVSVAGKKICTVNYDAIGRVDPAYGYGVLRSCDNVTPSLRQAADDSPLLKVICMNSQRVTSAIYREQLLHRNELLADRKATDLAVTHAQFSPTGNKLAFLIRWLKGATHFSQMRILDCVTGRQTLALDTQTISHYCWLTDSRILFWGRSINGEGKYHLLSVNNGRIDVRSVFEGSDGHPTQVSPNEVLVDEYPDRSRAVSISHLKFGGEEEIGQVQCATKIVSLRQPVWSRHERRVDCHPRFLRYDGEGKVVFNIDSAHTGIARNYDVTCTLQG